MVIPKDLENKIPSSHSYQGSFGTFPIGVRDKQRHVLDLCESAPDLFIRYTFHQLLDENRLAVAKILHAPVENVVLVPNATTAFNTVLRSLVWNDDEKDEILYLETIYGACGKTLLYIQEYSASRVTGRKIPVTYPIEDVDLVQLLKNAILKSREEGKRPRVAVFDTITSVPGVRVPFEALTALCREEGVLSLIDGAHAIGNIALDLEKLNPDFFLSNVHKWLFVPRGCCALYVALEHQVKIRSTLPTSAPFQPLSSQSSLSSTKSHFEGMFEYVGTVDDSAYLCVTEAVKFREEVCGGEEAILSYTQNLAKTGGALVASILDTEVLDNSTNTITNCAMVNVFMPLTTNEEDLKAHPTWYLVKEEEAQAVALWMTEKTVDEFGTYLFVVFFQGRWLTRISAQVYLDIDDFEWAGKTLKGLCERVGKGNFAASHDFKIRRYSL